MRTNWTLIIALWGALTGTLSLIHQWWNSHYRYREPLYLSGNIDSNTKQLTFKIRNRDPQVPAFIENVYQLRKSGWFSTNWYEFPEDSIRYKGKHAKFPLEINPRSAEIFIIKDDYFEKAAARAKSSNEEAVLFSIRAGSGYSFNLEPNINGKKQP